MHQSNDSLTKYPLGSLREFAFLAIPLILTCLSSTFFNICDRYFLSHYSVDALNACGVAGDLAVPFQLFCTITVMTGQVFVGRLYGNQEKEKIGPLIWQMIWFSFLSMLLTYPLSLLTEFYFHGTEIQASSLTYFRLISASNFLYPLSAAFSIFFVGRGKTKVILLANLIIQSIHIGLDYALIFGVKGLFLPLGIKGAAIATIISQTVLCTILGSLFLKKRYIKIYRTNLKNFDKKVLWRVLKTALPRAGGNFIMVFSWNLAARAMVVKGGDYLLARTIGVSIFGFTNFISLGIGNALTTIISYIFGSHQEKLIGKALRGSFYFLMLTTFGLAIPLILFQRELIAFFIKTTLSDNTFALLCRCCSLGLLLTLGNGIYTIGCKLITAYTKTMPYLLISNLYWLCFSIPIYYGITVLNWPPEAFFIFDASIACLIGSILIFHVQRKFFCSVKKAPLPDLTLL